MLVKMKSDLYYDTPEGTIGYVVRLLHCKDVENPLLLVRFSNGEEETAWKSDLECIQGEPNEDK
jgi:hypothetical protein